MLPFILYLLAGLLTGFHVYSLLTMAVYGAPATILEPASLVGSVCLLTAAFVSLFKPQAGAKIALPASLVAWCFYAPASLSTIRSGEIKHFSSAEAPYLAVTFLFIATMYAGLVIFSSTAPQKRSWIFPERATSGGRIAVGVLAVIVVAGSGIWVSIGAQRSRRPSSRFLIPSGYVGWIRVEFDVPGAARLAREGSQYVFPIPDGGSLNTSSPERYGWGKDRYFYASASGLRELPAGGPSEKRMIWGQLNGEDHSSSAVRQYEEFFVGTEQQFKQEAGSTRIGPISAAAWLTRSKG